MLSSSTRTINSLLKGVCSCNGGKQELYTRYIKYLYLAYTIFLDSYYQVMMTAAAMQWLFISIYMNEITINMQCSALV